jgi:hypothetical protein
MINLSEFIEESLLDKEDVLAKKLVGDSINHIRMWAKTVRKTQGRIKVNSKTGEVTLPDSCVSIYGEENNLPSGISFADFKPDSLELWWMTGEDIMKILPHVKLGDVRIHGPKDFTVFDKSLDVYSLDMVISDDLKFNEKVSVGEFKIEKLGSAQKNITISGLKNVCIDEGTGIRLHNINCKDSFSEIKTISDLYCYNVKGPLDLFKKAKNINEIKITECSDFNFSGCVCNEFEITGIDSRYDFKNLPKKFNILKINSDYDINEFDLSFIKDDNVKVYFNGGEIMIGDSESSYIIAQFQKMQKQNSHIDSLPDNIINYFQKNSTPAKYKIGDEHKVETSEKGVCIFIDNGGEGNGKYSRIMYFKDGVCKDVFKYREEGTWNKPSYAWSILYSFTNDGGIYTGGYSHYSGELLAFKLNDIAAKVIENAI